MILADKPVVPLIKSNITSRELSIIKTLASDKTIIIKPADKNLGLTVLDRAWYIKESHKHLHNPATYTPVEAAEIPVVDIIKSLRQLATTMKKAGVLNKQQILFVVSCINKYRVPVFYLLPKLHKLVLAGRPITSSVSWVLHPLSKILDDILQPFLKRTPAYLSDSADLIRALQSTTVPENSLLITADVDALYPSIPTPDGIDIVMKYLNTSPHFTDLNKPPHLRRALLLVLTNNYVEFNDKYYLQKSGTAMGTPVAVCYASLFLAALEEPLIKHPNVILYRRFIDDIFVIWRNNKNSSPHDFIKDLNSLHPNITLSHDIETHSVDFLDLTIYKSTNIKHGQLDTRIFQKKFNKFLYIPYSSYHADSQKQAFINGLLTSFLRVNSESENFYAISMKFFFRLRNRGYPADFLYPIFTQRVYDKKERATLLQPKIKERTTLPLTLKMQSSPSVEALKIKSFLQTCRTTLEAYKLPEMTLCLSRPPTLTAPLIKSKFSSM